MTPLPKPSVDTGAGLERVVSILQGVPSNYDTDLFAGILARAQDLSGVSLGEDPEKDVSLRVVADHARAVAFLIGDGVLPANEGRGYVLRRILRRAARHGVLLGVDRPFLHSVADVVIDEMGGAFPELAERRAYVTDRIRREEERFLETLSKGLALLERRDPRGQGAGWRGSPRHRRLQALRHLRISGGSHRGHPQQPRSRDRRRGLRDSHGRAARAFTRGLEGDRRRRRRGGARAYRRRRDHELLRLRQPRDELGDPRAAGRREERRERRRRKRSRGGGRGDALLRRERRAGGRPRRDLHSGWTGRGHRYPEAGGRPDRALGKGGLGHGSGRRNRGALGRRRRPLGDGAQPLRHASAARGAASGDRAPGHAEGFPRGARPSALRLHARHAAFGRADRPHRDAGESMDRVERRGRGQRALLPGCDQRRCHRDLRGEVRGSGTRGLVRRRLDGALRRHPRPRDRRHRTPQDSLRDRDRCGGAANRGAHRHRSAPAPSRAGTHPSSDRRDSQGAGGGDGPPRREATGGTQDGGSPAHRTAQGSARRRGLGPGFAGQGRERHQGHWPLEPRE